MVEFLLKTFPLRKKNLLLNVLEVRNLSKCSLQNYLNMDKEFSDENLLKLRKSKCKKYIYFVVDHQSLGTKYH